ncbi:hypothetical protein [Microvirga solisilvae]|uniref:hypothetical protein n=1 Tax=Microvirga solisilvae TaxID=2919498 RepID=UPI001FAF243D|nr:hypothetical protein [Microvirga solisilvae]
MSRLAILTLSLAAFSLSSPVAEAQDRSDLIPIFQQQVSACYALPAEVRGAEPVVVELRLKPNGALMHKPEVIRGQPYSITAEAALRAIDECTPFKISKELASRYRDWKLMRIQFSTQ